MKSTDLTLENEHNINTFEKKQMIENICNDDLLKLIQSQNR